MVGDPEIAFEPNDVNTHATRLACSGNPATGAIRCSAIVSRGGVKIARRGRSVPEGPEIRYAAKKLNRALAGRRARQVFFAFEHLKPFEDELRGRRVREVTSRGKAMLVRFTGAWNLYSHNQLYGRWSIVAAGRRPKSGRQLRALVENSQRAALLYSASDIAVLRDGELSVHPFLSKLGPDVLDADTKVEQVAARFASPAYRGRRLAALLLDQGFLSGLGNYLRSEILFVAGLAPELRPRDLDDAAIARLAEATLATARRSLRTRGITNEPEAARRMKAAGKGRSEYRFFVFDREGEPCQACGTSILREEQGSRRLYLCPRCQR